MKRTDLELMRYHDYESDPDERRRVERRLASDEASREHLAALARGSHAVRTWGKELELGSIADQVMGGIEYEESLRARKVQRLRRVSWSLMGSGLAAAACLWLWVGSGSVQTNAPTPDALAALPGASSPAAGAQPLAEMGAGVAIEKLDFGANSGSIFLVQGSNEATPVVWLSDPEGDQAKMEPL